MKSIFSSKISYEDRQRIIQEYEDKKRQREVENKYRTKNSEAFMFFDSGGYGRFFNPAIPSRIARVLMDNIHKALRGDYSARDAAIQILSSTHTKNMHDKQTGHQLEGLAKCEPTNEARKAVEYLRNLRY